jgi:hypothetical protein
MGDYWQEAAPCQCSLAYSLQPWPVPMWRSWRRSSVPSLWWWAWL